MSALKRQKEALEAALRVAEKALDAARGIGEEDGPCSCPSCQQVRDALAVVRKALGPYPDPVGTGTEAVAVPCPACGGTGLVWG